MLIYAGSYWLRVRVSRCKVQGLVRGGRWLAGRLSDSNGRSSNLQQRLRCFQRVAQLGTTQQQQQRSRFLVSRFAARAVRASSPYRSAEERHQQHRSYRPAPAHALYGCRSLAALLPCRATAAPSLYLTSLPSRLASVPVPERVLVCLLLATTTLLCSPPPPNPHCPDGRARLPASHPIQQPNPADSELNSIRPPARPLGLSSLPSLPQRAHALSQPRRLLIFVGPAAKPLHALLVNLIRTQGRDLQAQTRSRLGQAGPQCAGQTQYQSLDELPDPTPPTYRYRCHSTSLPQSTAAV
jgi:hypothetical protein